MSPWTVLGWVLVALVAIPFTARGMVGLIDLGSGIRRDAAAARKRKRADAGKLRCEYRDCDNIATRRGASGYCCDEHRHTYLTKRGGIGYAFPLRYVQKRTEAKEARGNR